MTPKPEDDAGRVPEDPTLDGLIRSASQLEPDVEVQMDEETMTAYLTGTASEEEKAKVRTALLRSSSFRRLLMEMAEDVGSALSEETSEALARAPEPLVPEIPADALGRGSRSAAQHQPAGEGSAWMALWSRLSELATRQKFGLRLAAAAAVALLLIMIAPPKVPHLPVAVEIGHSVDASQVFTPLRGPAAPGEVAERAQEAAVIALRRCLVWENGQYRLGEAVREGSHAGQRRELVVQIVDGKKRVLAVVRGSEPTRGNHPRSQDTSTEAWLVFLPPDDSPQVALRSFPMTAAAMALLWSPEMGTRGCLTFTYGVPGGFRATEPTPFTIIR